MYRFCCAWLATLFALTSRRCLMVDERDSRLSLTLGSMLESQLRVKSLSSEGISNHQETGVSGEVFGSTVEMSLQVQD